MNQEEFENSLRGIEAIIFDYGGIFVDIFHARTIQEIKAKSSHEAVEKLYGKHAQTDLFDRLETGNISENAFLEELKSAAGFQGELHELKKAWCAMLGAHPHQRLDYIKKLSRKYRIFMLSNINIIHEDFLEEKIKQDPRLAGFYEAFEKVYFSHHIGIRKPDASAFELILNENGLSGKNVAFVDDTKGHVESARKLGLRGIHLDPPNTFIFP